MIPKANQAGCWRLFLNLSLPRGQSVNDMQHEAKTISQYTNVDKVNSCLLQVGRAGAKMLAKVNIKNVYQENRHLVRMRRNYNLFIDTALPFGLRSTPQIFTSVSNTLRVGFIELRCYMESALHFQFSDDWGGQQVGMCRQFQTDPSNLQIIWECYWRYSSAAFWRILLDTVAGGLGCLRRRYGNWNTWMAYGWTCVPSLVGKLSHACKVAPTGRIFPGWVIDTSCKVYHWIPWIQVLGQIWHGGTDMEWFCRCAQPQVGTPDIICVVHGDVGRVGIRDQWVQYPRESHWRDHSIAIKEFLSIVLACGLWGSQCKHKQVLALCNNLSAVHILKSRTSRDPLNMHFMCASYELA